MLPKLPEMSARFLMVPGFLWHVCLGSQMPPSPVDSLDADQQCLCCWDSGSPGSQDCAQVPSLVTCIACNSVGPRAPVPFQFVCVSASHVIFKLVGDQTSFSSLAPDSGPTAAEVYSTTLCLPSCLPTSAHLPHNWWTCPKWTHRTPSMGSGGQRQGQRSAEWPHQF